MESFEQLGVDPQLVEGLAAEGIERPTPLQEEAVPVLLRGNNLVLAAGPGSGLLLAWAVPLLNRTEPEGDPPGILALTATSDVADRLAESAARLAAMTGHSVAALGSAWGVPNRAQMLFGTPAEVLASVGAGDSVLSAVRAFVLDQAQVIEQLDGLASVERVMDYLPAEAQRVITALPVTAPVSDLIGRHFRRAVTVPRPEADSPAKRGHVRFRVASEPREGAALSLADELLSEEARHLLVFCSNDDRAADLGDYLTLHGFAAGAPGDESVPVWLGVDALSARARAEGVDGVVVVSCDVPPDPDTLDRRHGFGSPGVVVVLPRELVHFKAVGRRTGYAMIPFPPPNAVPSSTTQLRATLEQALSEQDTAPYLSVLEPLFERYDPAEVAAAAVALLRSGPAAPPEPSSAGERTLPAAAPAWAKLFIGVGRRDDLRPGDLLGAITGEAGVDGKSVGKIDIRDSHSIVEVHDSVARTVIAALNGTTIRGRAVRADFDRPRRQSRAAGPK